MDYAALAYYGAFFLCGLTAICITTLIAFNRLSDTFVLAGATTVAALLFFALQSSLLLKASTQTEPFGIEYVIDRGDLNVQKPWGDKQRELESRELVESSSAANDVTISNWVRLHAPTAFAQEQREKLAHDLALFDVVSLLTSTTPWNRPFIGYYGRGGGIEIRDDASPSESTMLEEKHIHERLRTAGNLYAEAPLHMTEPAAFPPDSQMEITSQKVKVANPYCVLTFEIVSPTLGTGSVRNQQTLDDGQPRYDAVVVPIAMRIEYSGTRIHSPTMKDHQDWIQRVVRIARVRFAIPSADAGP